jgi:hypothetical protein
MRDFFCPIRGCTNIAQVILRIGRLIINEIICDLLFEYQHKVSLLNLCSAIRKSDSCLIFLVQSCEASHFSIQRPADSIETDANIQSEPLLLMSRCDPQDLQPRSSVHDPNSYRSGTETARTVATTQ